MFDRHRLLPLGPSSLPAAAPVSRVFIGRGAP